MVDERGGSYILLTMATATRWWPRRRSATWMKGARLDREVKRLALEADDDMIDALLKNAEVFSRIPKKEG